jgi:hypothetical protein
MPTENAEVLRLSDIDGIELCNLLAKFEIELKHCDSAQPIPASYWGDDEAGLRGNHLYARADTPLHSILHEASHYICMDSERRLQLERDAGSDDAEESAVCYLQVLLSDDINCVGRKRLFADMDVWGYSFRLESTQAWFENDAEDARSWLIRNGLINDHGLTYQLA